MKEPTPYIRKDAHREWLHSAEGRYPQSFVSVDGPRDRWGDVTLTIRGCGSSNVCLEFESDEENEADISESLAKLAVLQAALDETKQRLIKLSHSRARRRAYDNWKKENDAKGA